MMTILRFATVTMITALLSLTADGAVRRVNANVVGGTGDGSSWPNAYADLQPAIAASSAGDEIWVAVSLPAQASYKPTAVWPVGGGTRNRTYRIPLGVKVYGGFIGTESALPQRNPELNITILDGDIGTAVDPSDNCYHVVYFQNTEFEQFDTKLSGFTIRNGNANVTTAGSLDGKGGGILIVDNPGGGGESGPLLDRLIIERNNAYVGGGGIRVAGKALTHIANTRFEFITVENGNGGGLIQDEGNGTVYVLQNCIFYANSVDAKSGSGQGFGGGAYGSPGPGGSIVNTTFYGNTCAAAGGAFQGLFGPNHPAYLRNCIVWANSLP